MDLRYLRYFIVVAEELNFTRAADRLHTVQPSLSQQIRRLEDIVGTPLFYRDKHRIELTEAGRVFIEQSRKILESADRGIEMARKAARSEAGNIAIGFVPGAETVIFPCVLPPFHERYPEIQLRLVSAMAPELALALQNHMINVGFFGGPVEDPDLESEVVIRMPLIPILRADHPLALLDQIPVRKLAELPFVRPSRAKYAAPNRVIDAIAADAGVSFNTSTEVDSALATVYAVASGMGFAIVPDYARQFLPATVVARRLELERDPLLDVLAVYRKDDKLPALVSFLTLLRNCIIYQE